MSYLSPAPGFQYPNGSVHCYYFAPVPPLHMGLYMCVYIMGVWRGGVMMKKGDDTSFVLFLKFKMFVPRGATSKLYGNPTRHLVMEADTGTRWTLECLPSGAGWEVQIVGRLEKVGVYLYVRVARWWRAGGDRVHHTCRPLHFNPETRSAQWTARTCNLCCFWATRTQCACALCFPAIAAVQGACPERQTRGGGWLPSRCWGSWKINLCGIKPLRSPGCFSVVGS